MLSIYSALMQKRVVLSAILLFVFILFLPSVRYGLVHDDMGQISLNPRLTAWSYVPGYFTSDVWAHLPANYHGYYRPLFLVWLRLSYAILGKPGDIWHLPSILAHVAVTLCVFLLLLQLVKDFKGAALGAALFAIHPIQTETVAWISASGEMLLTIFLSLSVYFYVARKKPISWASLVFATLAMFTKETGIVAPLLILAFEWIQTRFRDAAVNAIPYFASALFYLALRANALGTLATAANSNLSLSAMLPTWPIVLAEYALHLAWPVHLSPSYDIPTGSALWPFLLLIVVVAALVWIIRKSSKFIQFGFAWFAITLAPTLISHYVDPIDYVHDRYLYLPSVGLALMAAVWFARLRFTVLRSVAASIVGFALCCGTHQALPVWKDNISLFTRAVETAPDNPDMIIGLAASYMKAHREAEAYPLFQKLVDRYPDWPLANDLMARYYQQIGNSDQAEYYFSISSRLSGTALQ
jgi:tetratricopeptide (TPR) repeat protein